MGISLFLLLSTNMGGYFTVVSVTVNCYCQLTWVDISLFLLMSINMGGYFTVSVNVN